MDTDTEIERQQIFRALTEACRPLSSPGMRKSLGLCILAELLDEERVPAECVLEAIARAEAVYYLHRLPPTGRVA